MNHLDDLREGRGAVRPPIDVEALRTAAERPVTDAWGTDFFTAHDYLHSRQSAIFSLMNKAGIDTLPETRFFSDEKTQVMDLVTRRRDSMGTEAQLLDRELRSAKGRIDVAFEDAKRAILEYADGSKPKPKKEERVDAQPTAETLDHPELLLTDTVPVEKPIERTNEPPPKVAEEKSDKRDQPLAEKASSSKKSESMRAPEDAHVAAYRESLQRKPLPEQDELFSKEMTIQEKKAALRGAINVLEKEAKGDAVKERELLVTEEKLRQVQKAERAIDSGVTRWAEADTKQHEAETRFIENRERYARVGKIVNERNEQIRQQLVEKRARLTELERKARSSLAADTHALETLGPELENEIHALESEIRPPPEIDGNYAKPVVLGYFKRRTEDFKSALRDVPADERKAKLAQAGDLMRAGVLASERLANVRTASEEAEIKSEMDGIRAEFDALFESVTSNHTQEQPEKGEIQREGNQGAPAETMVSSRHDTAESVSPATAQIGGEVGDSEHWNEALAGIDRLKEKISDLKESPAIEVPHVPQHPVTETPPSSPEVVPVVTPEAEPAIEGVQQTESQEAPAFVEIAPVDLESILKSGNAQQIAEEIQREADRYYDEIAARVTWITPLQRDLFKLRGDIGYSARDLAEAGKPRTQNKIVEQIRREVAEMNALGAILIEHVRIHEASNQPELREKLERQLSERIDALPPENKPAFITKRRLGLAGGIVAALGALGLWSSSTTDNETQTGPQTHAASPNTPGAASRAAAQRSPEAAPVAGTVSAEAGAETSVAEVVVTQAMITQGNGADTLFYSVQHQLREHYGNDLSNASDAVRNIIGMNPHMLGRALGFSSTTGSRVMHVGDKLIVDSHGTVSFYDAPTKQSTVLMENGRVSRTMHDPMRPDRPRVRVSYAQPVQPRAVPATPRAAPEAAPAPVAAPQAPAPETPPASPPRAEAPAPSSTSTGSEEQAASAPEAPAPATAAPKPTPESGTTSTQEQPASQETRPLPRNTQTQESTPGTAPAQPINAEPNRAEAPPAQSVPAAPPRVAETAPAATANQENSTVFENVPGWSVVRSANVDATLDSPNGPQENIRSSLVDLIRQSGTGPREEESVEQYVARARAAIAEGNVSRPSVVEPAQGMFVAQGGDFSARFWLGKEFVRRNGSPEDSVGVIILSPTTGPGIAPGYRLTGSVLANPGRPTAPGTPGQSARLDPVRMIPPITPGTPIRF